MPRLGRIYGAGRPARPAGLPGPPQPAGSASPPAWRWLSAATMALGLAAVGVGGCTGPGPKTSPTPDGPTSQATGSPASATSPTGAPTIAVGSLQQTQHDLALDLIDLGADLTACQGVGGDRLDDLERHAQAWLDALGGPAAAYFPATAAPPGSAPALGACDLDGIEAGLSNLAGRAAQFATAQSATAQPADADARALLAGLATGALTDRNRLVGAGEPALDRLTAPDGAVSPQAVAALAAFARAQDAAGFRFEFYTANLPVDSRPALALLAAQHRALASAIVRGDLNNLADPAELADPRSGVYPVDLNLVDEAAIGQAVAQTETDLATAALALAAFDGIDIGGLSALAAWSLTQADQFGGTGLLDHGPFPLMTVG